MGLTGLLNSLARHLQLCCSDQAFVVQKMDNAIYRINLYPVHKYSENQLSYPVDGFIRWTALSIFWTTGARPLLLRHFTLLTLIKYYTHCLALLLLNVFSFYRYKATVPEWMPLTGLLWLQAAFGSSCWLYQPLSTSLHAHFVVDEFNVKKIVKEQIARKL